MTSGKTKDMECLFTWHVKIDYIADLKNIPRRLQERLKYCPRRYHATYYNILAFVSHLEKKTDVALEYLAKAEAVLKEEKRDEADFLVTYSSFAWLYHHLGNLDDMETYLGKVRSIGEGGDIAVEAEKGWSFIRLGAKFYQRARKCFEKAVEAKPNSVSYNVGYAIVLFWLEENVNTDVNEKPEADLAAKQLERALDLDPDDDEIKLLSALRLHMCNPSKSSELIYKVLTKCADIPEMNKYAAHYFWRERSTEETLKLLQMATETVPDSYFLHDQMGLWHWYKMLELKRSDRQNDNATQMKAALTESIHHLRKSVELKPSNTYAWAQLAEAYGEAQHLYDDAETIFTRLLADYSELNDAERQNCHKKYGEFLLYKKKQPTKAVEQLKNAYRVRIEGRARHRVRERLLRISQQIHKEHDQILAFLSAMDNLDRQLTTAPMAEKTVSGLGDNLETKLTI